ncbi:MAG: hypothetical protein KDK76_05195 [Chlamydiia bacterium]|nr:hypothetical protein [Chlamydiia bacterium]
MAPKDVEFLRECLDQAQSVQELRQLLEKKDLNLVVILMSSQFSCLEWDIRCKKVCKVLDMGLRIRLSRESNGVSILDSVNQTPIRVKEGSWVGLDDLFETLKEGIKSHLKTALI